MRQKLVLPVRFTALGEAVQSTTKELSEEGVFIRCVEPPPPGAEVMLEIQLPGEGPGVVGAEVDEVAIDPSHSGFWARFLEPDEVFLARVREALHDKRPLSRDNGATNTIPGVGRNRRTTTRYLDKLVIKLGGRGVMPGVFAFDVSSTGLFVLMPNPPELDAVLQVDLELPDRLPPCGVLGLVVRRITPEEGQRIGKVPGAGLVFIGGGDEFRKRYDAYLVALGKSARPQTLSPKR